MEVNDGDSSGEENFSNDDIIDESHLRDNKTTLAHLIKHIAEEREQEEDKKPPEDDWDHSLNKKQIGHD